MTKLNLLLVGLATAATATAGFNPANIDTNSKPQDDFYQYATGAWLKTAKIAGDHVSAGTNDELEDANLAKLRGILESVEADNPKRSAIEQKVGDFYASGMDLAAVNAAGVTPLKTQFDEIKAAQTVAEIGTEIARLHLYGVDAVFGLGSEQDPKNSSMMIAGVGQGGLGLPERDYYLRTDPDSVALREKYVAHVTKMLTLAGDSAADAAAEAKEIMDLETALANASKKAEDLRDPIANYHKLPLADVQKLSPHFDWAGYLKNIDLGVESIDVGQPEFLTGFDNALQKYPAATWQAYFRWHLIHSYARFLSEPFVTENWQFYAHTLAGTNEQSPRWKRVQYVIDEQIGEALGQLYVAKYFPPESKAQALKLILSIQAALKNDIAHLDWMDDATKAKAQAKLAALTIKIGYPDKFIDYGTLTIDRGPYVLNVLRAHQFLGRRDLNKIGKPWDRTEWYNTPPTVNAYYSPTGNEIVFPAGILQPPFFDPKADPASNYGSIGAIMGHEMTHGFDDEGRQFDKDGNLSDWWSPESAKRFQEHAQAIVKQFDGYVATGDLHVNGKLTQGENIADLGGVKIAFAALEKTLGSAPRTKTDGFTPEQRYFLSWANDWRSLERPEFLRLATQTDPHSPDKLRVNGPLSNLQEFYDAFQVPEGSPMRRAQADRVQVW